MDPDATMVALLQAFCDQDRARCWTTLEDMNDWLAKGGAFPDKVRAIPVSDQELTLLAVGLMLLMSVVAGAQPGGPIVPNLIELGGMRRVAQLGAEVSTYVRDPTCLKILADALRAFTGLTKDKPL